MGLPADKANSIQKLWSSDDSSSANICSGLRMLRISATSRLCPLSCSRCKVISKWQCDGDDNDYGDDDGDGGDHLLQGWGGPLQLHVLLLPCLEAGSTLATILVLDFYTAMFTPPSPSISSCWGSTFTSLRFEFTFDKINFRFHFFSLSQSHPHQLQSTRSISEDLKQFVNSEKILLICQLQISQRS